MLVKVVHLAFQCRTSGQLLPVHGALHLQLEDKQNKQLKWHHDGHC